MKGVKYTDDEIFEWAKEAITKNNLFFLKDVVAFLPCGTSRFYEACPSGSERSEYLKSMISDNIIKMKTAIRRQLFKNGKGGDLIALYKMICTEDERRALSMSYIDARHEMPNHNGQLLLHPKKED